MQKRNLTGEKIIKAAFALAEEIGFDRVTFQKIADKLHIKYPSLYNHFDNMDALKTEMTVYVIRILNFKLMQGLVGKSGEDAIRQFAHIYRDFAFENREAYKLFMNIPSTKNKEINCMARETMSIIKSILNFYIDDRVILVHKSRELRSILHGFVSLTFLGYFQHKPDVEVEDSFEFMIDDFIFSIENGKSPDCN
ncbi:TetR/AcrR family transcriptional regulator [Clostridium sp. MT-14]|jgi:AcrR family transcriptional regulator|uniref:TetR/AcrR family transcriptional regulator n=1 Tax=Clostridium aromativorans TaxID=2836848 RepID=A0ABS8NAU2_9CLOT|nr:MULTISPECIES: TetR/AcrR family transcriptional regulator [Clostridium]KAA8677562.1 TetR/AcrR family transcriptional regulator [Clostridium sp. HV4-5-A1G]MCC9295803.1 TetR/AcrR family transcriptional regulator [Clostridium aromativorans]CAB1246657.1 TetR family transcriptional regulator [Clostridiaceae bacterium BL-3]